MFGSRACQSIAGVIYIACIVCVDCALEEPTANASDLLALGHELIAMQQPPDIPDNSSEWFSTLTAKGRQLGIPSACVDIWCPKDNGLNVRGNTSAEYCKLSHPGEFCYTWCCDYNRETNCFPGEATATVQGRGHVPLAQLQIGDKVLTRLHGMNAYEPVLAFLHVVQRESTFAIVIHEHGEFRVSPSHLVFVASDSGGSSWFSKMVSSIRIGDAIFAAGVLGAPWNSKPSRVLAIHYGVTKLGMYAPLTLSGTIVVDGVVASNYASPSQRMHLTHSLAHAFFWPVRFYHYLGLASSLQSMWKKFCSSTRNNQKNWLCHGGDFVEDYSEANSEELHPYVRFMWKGLKIDSLWFSSS